VISASALSEDFSLESLKEDITLCTSSPDVADILTITNTGIIPGTYHIKVSGDIAEFTTLSQTSFSLEPADSLDVFVYIRAPNTGKHTLNINMYTDFGLEKSFQKEVIINNCQNLLIFPKTWSHTTAPCQAATFEFEIFNTGDYTEVYEIKTASEFAELSHNPAIIEPNTAQPVFVYTTPGCELYGNQNFEVQVTAKTSGYKATFPLYLNILPLYNFSLASQEEYSVCESSDTQIPIKLSNKAELQNAYKLTLNSPRWVKLDKKYPILAPKQEAQINLNITDPKEGAYNITIKAESLLGDLYLEKSFILYVTKCHEFELKLPGDKDTICASTTKRHSIEVINKGTDETTLDLSLEAPEWVSLSEYELTLEPNSSENIILMANPPEDVTGKHNIEIKAAVGSLIKSEKMQLEVITGKQCTAFEFQSSKNINVEQFHQMLKLPVANSGAEQDTFIINIDGPEFITLATDELTLEPGEASYIELEINPGNSTGTYEVLIQASGKEQSYSDVFKIKIGESQFLEFLRIYLLYVIIGIAIILVITGVLKLRELKSKK
ncbi:hypothetical protein KY328_02795, partial [Candidatus Woesearchaeota archaeon]|nr:hypothetical protein [Candidatus Woesearchaeota archaeon]